MPFILTALGTVVDPIDQYQARSSLYLYGAVILSFVGALHWGFAMTVSTLNDKQKNALYVWSVVPSLLAWFAFFLPTMVTGLILIAGFLAHYARDKSATVLCQLPSWYLPLRFRLTLVASVCLAIGTATAGTASL